MYKSQSVACQGPPGTLLERRNRKNRPTINKIGKIKFPNKPQTAPSFRGGWLSKLIFASRRWEIRSGELTGKSTRNFWTRLSNSGSTASTIAVRPLS